jgi:GntR family transcriptional regulator, transcriptional repressor for pyruvate dehydrogenase complex
MQSDSLLQRVKKVRISDTVVDQIINLIEKGKLPVGAQLPGERDLVNQLQVGRASVREALRILEAQGVIEVRPGIGAFIISDVSKEYEGIKLWFQEHAHEILDILQIREALERQAAALACAKAAPDDIARMEAVLDEAEQSLVQNDLEQLGHLDQQFHRLVGQASGNELLAQIVNSIIEATVSPRRSIQRIPGRARTSLEEHRAIWQAIRDRDTDAAEQAIKDHITSVRNAIESLSKDQGK